MINSDVGKFARKIVQKAFGTLWIIEPTECKASDWQIETVSSETVEKKEERECANQIRRSAWPFGQNDEHISFEHNLMTIDGHTEEAYDNQWLQNDLHLKRRFLSLWSQ